MLTLRISSGSAKNKRLKTPNIPDYRAVQEVSKQAIFSIIGEKVENAGCLDLFAGSGNLGIEALSRGAAWCDFVDSEYEATTAIEKNVFDCGFAENAEIFRKEAVKYTANTEKMYDLVFMDPFYHDTAHVFLMKTIEELLNPEGLVVILYGDKLNLDTILKDTDFEVVTTRKFGQSRFSILQHRSVVN